MLRSSAASLHKIADKDGTLALLDHLASNHATTEPWMTGAARAMAYMMVHHPGHGLRSMPT